MITSRERHLYATLLGTALVLATLSGCTTRGGPGEQRRYTTPADTAVDEVCGEATQLQIATFNVHRLFDSVCDSGRCASDDFEAAPSESAFLAHAAQIAAGIDALGADVVLLQEIENQSALNALQDALISPYPVAVLGETGSAGSVDVAVLARGTWLETRTHRETPLPLPDGGSTTFARELLEVHLSVEGHVVVVFAVHFRSKAWDDPDRRLAEATAAQEIASATTAELEGAELEGAVVVLGGDLNDTPDSPALLALTAGGASLRVAESLGADDWTYSYGGNRQAIDHLLLFSTAEGYVAGSAEIHFSRGEQGFAGSDHAALSACFQLR